MKILITQCFDFPEGQSNRSYLFAQELSKIGHNVTFFTNRYNHLDSYKKKINKNFDNKIEHIFFDNKYFRNQKFLSVIFNSFGLIKILKKKKFDLIIGPSVPLINSFFALIFKKKKTKFFYEIRDVWPDALIFNNAISKLNPIYILLKIFEICIYKFSDGLISALPKTYKYVKKYNKNLPQLYLPNSYKSFSSFKKKFRKKNLKIIYIGRFNTAHDIEIILLTAKYLLLEKKFKNITFNLYGYGEKINYIKQYVSFNNLTNVKIKGKIEKNKIYKLSKRYDLALCTITDSNAFKWGTNLNKIYEYFNSSMPVIFSGKVPYNPVKLANCGFVSSSFNYKDLSNDILKFKKLNIRQKEKFSINAKKFFDANYSLNINTKKLNNFIESI